MADLGSIVLVRRFVHTYGHHSLLAATRWGTLIVSGDAVMTLDWFEAQEGYYNCVDFGLAAETIRRIGQAADLVIPGHGNWFPAGTGFPRDLTA